ncbi:arylsulfatase A-like enzyme [Wenyingzhuangia heitensis]|uniref:Arylsulfatase A-like enzyme n=1 Tax=Wenyingzhuangia heitensis TaxID=1487859 RepID=A0ABX0UBC7_9FLAO|nr:sulfatase-like hydrolase/transferase [Wenyingzhuangia heitensis]NIJ44871.1 arylsulfatase A-like enzyme [Wenyingzhuangia heitensis]
MKIKSVLVFAAIAMLGSSKIMLAQQQPNILWVLTDDQRWDSIETFNEMLTGKKESKLGYVESPNVDALAALGTTFINTYCQAQGCAPSRASMHSGRYPFRSGIYQFEYFNNNTNNSYPFLPEEMVKLGYQTFHVGKLGVRIKTIKNGKAVSYPLYQNDVSFKTLADDMLPEWGKVSKLSEIDGVKLKKPLRNVTYLKDENGKVYYKSKELEEQNPQFVGMAKEAYDKYHIMYKHNNSKKDFETPFSKGILAGVSPQSAGKTRDGNYTTVFIDFLKNENKKFKAGRGSYDGIDTSKPLFAHIGYDFPHTPVLPPKSFRDRFHKKDYKMPVLTDSEFKKMAKAFQKRVKKSFSDDFTDEEKQKMVRDYYAFCAYGDDLIGQATKEFIEYSEQKNKEWLIVYVCGDHGWKLNDHGSIAKNTPWEIDSHNPIVVVSSDKKKFPAGKVVTDFTEFVDIAPTILNAGGANLKKESFNHLDGFDLQKVATEKIAARDYVLGESHHSIGPRAYIRTKEYALSLKTRPSSKRGVNMNWAMTASDKELDMSLYDAINDPDEINNLANNPKYKKVVAQLKEKLLAIVIGDGRAEINWGGDNYGKNTKAIGTDVYYNKPFAKGAHDYKLKLK